VTQRWLILADDLTGAADAGVPFARRGHATEVIWQETLPADDVSVIACDTGSRGLSAASAAERQRAAAHRLLTPGGALFKKMDSTLRGQPAAEVAALCAVLRVQQRPAFAICAPANPAMGRVTCDGRVLVHGVPLEQSETWTREHSYQNADLAAIFAGAGLNAVKLSLAEVRGSVTTLGNTLRAAAGASSDSGTVVICDAETDDDLSRIVGAARVVPEAFYVGTAGLARALAASLPDAAPRGIKYPATRGGTLVAVGSRAQVSRAAALALATHLGISTERVEPAARHDGSSQALFAMNIGARLVRGETAIALLDGPEPRAGALDPELVRGFARTLTFALERMGGLIVTGGETASALLGQAGVHSIRLLDEIEPGMALGVTCGAVEVPIVTKPGAFGDEKSLIRCMERLRRLSQ
jgi:uncharacterized protein YgbK (DUF1537 family)